jgi:hypothetical protein
MQLFKSAFMVYLDKFVDDIFIYSRTEEEHSVASIGGTL